MTDVTCRAFTERDYPAVREIIAGAFGDHVRDNPVALEQLDREPWYDPAHLVVAESGGEVVSFLGVRDSGLWLGGRLLSVGLVGTVCTREVVRGRGIGSRLVRFAHERMAAQGLAVSVLHTSEVRYAFYERLGYRRAVTEQPRLMVNLSAATAASASGSRAATAHDAAALNALYAATYGQATGAWGRSDAFWQRRLDGVPKLWSRVLRFEVAGSGAPEAYAAYEETEGAGTVHELACAAGAEDAAVGLLQELLVRWRENGVLVAELDLSSTHPLRPRVAPLVAEDRTGWDVVFTRVHDEDAFLNAATSLLQERARAAGFRLTVERQGDAVVLGGPGEEPLQVELAELAALVYNGRLAVTHEGLAGRMAARPWTEGLFPDTGAARCGLDGY